MPTPQELMQQQEELRAAKDVMAQQAEARAQESPPAPTGQGVSGFPDNALDAAWDRMFQLDLPPNAQDAHVQVARNVSVMGMATMGGYAGSKVPVAPGMLGLFINPVTGAAVGSMVGAAAAVFAPEASLSLAESLGLIEPGTTEQYGLTMEQQKRVAYGEAMLDLHFGAFANLLGIAGRSFARGATKIQKPREPFPGEAPRQPTGQHLAEDVKTRFGIELLPWQVGRGGLARGMLVVMGKFPLVGAPAKGPVFGSSYRMISDQAKVEKGVLETMSSLPKEIGNVKDFPDLSHAILGDARNLAASVSRNFQAKYEAVWDLADAAKVHVKMKGFGKSLAETKSELASNAKVKRVEDPETGEVSLVPAYGPEQRRLLDFIEKELDTVEGVQSLRGADDIVNTIDQYIASIEPAQRKSVMRYVNKIREGAKNDMVNGVWNKKDQHIAEALAELDTEYHNTLATLFETTSAKKFGRVVKRGIRGFTFDPSTTTGIDKLSELLLDLDSPKAIDELLRLVSPQTKKDMTASLVQRGITLSYEKTSEQAALGTGRLARFDPGKFEAFFGFDSLNPQRGRSLDKLLSAAGSPIKREDLALLSDALSAVGEFSVGAASSFIARRAQIGGTKALLSGLIGGATLGGGAGAYAGSSGGALGTIVSSLIGASVMLVGVRGLVRSISNPAAARSLRAAARPIATLAEKRKNVYRFLRLTFDSMIAEAQAADVKDQYVQSGTFEDYNRELDALRETANTYIEASMEIMNDPLYQKMDEGSRGSRRKARPLQVDIHDDDIPRPNPKR